MSGGAGPSSISEKERKEMMDAVTKIIEKPIVIQNVQESLPSRSNHKHLKNLSKVSESSLKESSSIKESFERAHNDDDDDIEEDIVDEVGASKHH